MHDGLVVVDKPAGRTSHDVVATLRRVYGQRRVGHAGTLDPDATGVLLVGLGRVTRLLRFLQEHTKTYRADVVLGVATSTLDAGGAVLDRRPMPVTRAQVEEAARRFLGDGQQVPPMVSALKVGGRRLHDLARRLTEFDVPVARLSRALFEEHRFAYLQLLGEALANAELCHDQAFVWTAVTQDMLQRHDVTMEEVEGLIDILRRTAEAEVTCVLKEEVDGSVRVSLRSLGSVDVRRIAEAHGGGGHRYAAGFTSELGIPTTVARIRAAL